MNRRKFLQIAGLTGSGLVASATMAEAGLFAEIASWLKRRPVWSIPQKVTLANIAQYSDFVSFSDLSLATAIDPTVEACANELAYRAAITFHTITADALLPELACYPMVWEGTGIPRSALSAWQEMEASDLRAIGNLRTNMLTWEGTGIPRGAVQRAIDHSDESRLAYTKNDKYETCRVVYNDDTHKIDLIPSTSLAFNT